MTSGEWDQPDTRRGLPRMLVVAALFLIPAIVGAAFVLTRREQPTGGVDTGGVERLSAGIGDPAVLDPRDIVEVIPADGIP
ncbi:MAG: hypothetical protein ACR2L3_05915, partial [Actinomycetota bacterium]